MSKFMRVVVLFFCAAVIFSLASCTAAQEAGGYVNGYISDNTQYSTYADDTAEASGDPGGDNGAVYTAHTPFTGERGQAYELLWPEGREREWEEDIISFAKIILTNHPIFIDFDFLRVEGRAGYVRDYSVSAFNQLLQRTAVRNEILTSDPKDMRDTLRKLFLDRINTLIAEIQNLSDYEVKLGISEIAALFGDIHTSLSLPAGDVFPLQIISLHEGIYLVGVPKEMEHALYGKLTAINGVGIDEVIEKFERVIPHENEYGRHDTIPRLLMVKEILRFINVVDDSGMACFTVMDAYGGSFDIHLRAIEQEVLHDMDEAEFLRHDFSTLMHMHPEEYFWYEHFSDDSIMYVRVSSFRHSGASRDRISELTAELRNWAADSRIQKFIIDLRQNRGGVIDWPAAHDLPLLSEISESLYVIIDASSHSRSVIVTLNLSHIENVTIVGEPSGQPKNFFAGTGRALPNSGLWYGFSTNMRVYSNNEDIILRPDIFIPLAIEDVIANRDPVLEFIQGR